MKPKHIAKIIMAISFAGIATISYSKPSGYCFNTASLQDTTKKAQAQPKKLPPPPPMPTTPDTPDIHIAPPNPPADQAEKKTEPAINGDAKKNKPTKSQKKQ